jgi:hypothetical protein
VLTEMLANAETGSNSRLWSFGAWGMSNRFTLIHDPLHIPVPLWTNDRWPCMMQALSVSVSLSGTDWRKLQYSFQFRHSPCFCSN